MRGADVQMCRCADEGSGDEDVQICKCADEESGCEDVQMREVV
jgi:hypothetical protein